jgi:acyl-coenzyme A thioesterase PaaI-like protein
MPPSLDQARAALAAQPFSRLLGARLSRFGPDEVELAVPPAPSTANSTGSPTAGCSAMPPTTPSPSPPARWPARRC